MSSLQPLILLQTTAPAASEPSPEWVNTILGLVLASMLCFGLLVFGLLAWGLSKISAGPSRNRRRGRRGTWVAVPHDDLWIHFEDPEDAGDPRQPRVRGAPRSRRGPLYQADPWDEP